MHTDEIYLRDSVGSRATSSRSLTAGMTWMSSPWLSRLCVQILILILPHCSHIPRAPFQSETIHLLVLATRYVTHAPICDRSMHALRLPLWHGRPNISKQADPDNVQTVAAEVQVVTLLVAYGTRESASFNLGASLLEENRCHTASKLMHQRSCV